MFRRKKSEVKKNSFFQDVVDLVRFTILVLIIIIPIRIFIAQPFIVSGQSMMPTFENGDYLIVDEISHRLHNPKRGEVIIFRLPQDHKRFLIKRVIGLPGETVTISGDKITITKKDGTKIQLKEDYIKEDFSTYGKWVLKDNEYFVMGDNRNNSSDSRSWGLLDKNLIIGKTFLRLFPFTHFNVDPGQIEPSQMEVPLPKKS